MIFTKRCSCGVRDIVWVLGVILLVGCSSSSPKKQTDSRQTAEPVAAASVGIPILPVGPATSNPYLQNKPAINNAAAQQFANATRAMRNKQWQQAETLLQQLVAQNSKFSGAYLNLGLTYRAQKENKRAEQAFVSAINANHTNLDAYNQLAILQREQGRFSEAEANYKKALSVWPYHAESHKNIGILYDLYLGKNAEALAHFEAYQQIRGDSDKQVTSWIADLQRRMGITPRPKAAPVEVTGESSVNEDETSDE